MSISNFKIYISYTQLCIFNANLKNPFNDWSDRNFTQGFSWRDKSVSFRSLIEDGDHEILLFVNEPIPTISNGCVRAIKVPFVIEDNRIEIGGISDTVAIDIPSGEYSLQVEFYEKEDGLTYKINVRLNVGNSDFVIIKSDESIVVEEKFDLKAIPAV